MPASIRPADTQRDLSALWWLFGIEGLFSIVFGVVVRYLPSAIDSVILTPVSLVFFIILCGLYVLGCGLILLVGGVYAFDQHLSHAKFVLAEGCAALLLGIYITASLGLSVPELSVVFAIHAALLCLFRLVLFFRLKHHPIVKAIIGSAAGFAFLAAIFFVVTRNSDTDNLIGWIALYSLISGAVHAGVSIRLRHLHLTPSVAGA